MISLYLYWYWCIGCKYCNCGWRISLWVWVCFLDCLVFVLAAPVQQYTRHGGWSDTLWVRQKGRTHQRMTQQQRKPNYNHDAGLGPQDLLLWLQYTNTHGLQKSCGGKGTVRPLSQEESVWTLALTGFYCFSRPLTSKVVLIGLFWVVIFCRQQRRGCHWIYQRRIFAM